MQPNHRRHGLLKHTHATAGDIDDAALSANVALLNRASQDFTAAQRFTGAASATVPAVRIGTNADAFASGALVLLGVSAAGAASFAIRNETDNIEGFYGIDTAKVSIGSVTNHDFAIFTNNTQRLTVTNDGRVYGSALHNNAGAVTGTTNQYLASGTYTPTLTNVANISASTAYVCQWMRVGNVVTVSGRVDIDAVSATTQTTLGMSLPIASDFAANEQCGGACIANAVAGSLNIHADTTNNRANFSSVDINSTANTAFWFTFTYLIV